MAIRLIKYLSVLHQLSPKVILCLLSFLFVICLSQSVLVPALLIIVGYGVFAKTHFNPQDFLLEYAGEHISPVTADQFCDQTYIYYFHFRSQQYRYFTNLVIKPKLTAFLFHFRSLFFWCILL